MAPAGPDVGPVLDEGVPPLSRVQEKPPTPVDQPGLVEVLKSKTVIPVGAGVVGGIGGEATGGGGEGLGGGILGFEQAPQVAGQSAWIAGP